MWIWFVFSVLDQEITSEHTILSIFLSQPFLRQMIQSFNYSFHYMFKELVLKYDHTVYEYPYFSIPKGNTWFGLLTKNGKYWWRSGDTPVGWNPIPPDYKVHGRCGYIDWDVGVASWHIDYCHRTRQCLCQTKRKWREKVLRRDDPLFHMHLFCALYF